MATTRFADHLLTGIHSARPAASAVPAGSLYSCTTHGLIYQSDGSSAWSTYATLGGTETLPVTIIDAKGDVIAGTAADTAARLAVGSDGQVLTADAASTPGVKWSTPAGSSGALTLLSTTTLGGSGTFDVSSISGSYNDLVLVLIVRGTDAGASDNPLLRLNADTAGNYRWERVSITGTTTSGLDGAAATSIHCGTMPCAGAPASYFGASMIEILGYASTSWFKNVLWSTHATFASASNNSTLGRGGSLWLSTAAVTRVQIFGSSTANLVTGSQLRIYGRL